jgi:hypothetical protein
MTGLLQFAADWRTYLVAVVIFGLMPDPLITGPGAGCSSRAEAPRLSHAGAQAAGDRLGSRLLAEVVWPRHMRRDRWSDPRLVGRLGRLVSRILGQCAPMRARREDVMDPDEVDDDVFEQLDELDTLDRRGPADPLDEGWSPPERPWGVDDWGITPREQANGEGLDRRLAREVPESWAGEDEGDGLGDVSDTDGEVRDAEVGNLRAGRLTAGGDDRGDHELYASDAGVDGAAASAEEAAVHLVDYDQ